MTTTMKKTYIIPQVLIVRVAPQRIISASETTMTLNDTQVLEAGDILTKQNNYSVWSDDWSAE